VGHQAVVTDFAHTWESDGHVLRVAVSSKNEYTFSVDGVVYEDFPSEAEANALAKEIAAKTKKETTPDAGRQRRNSVNKKSDSPALERRQSASFDPFASGGSAGTAVTSSSSFFDESDNTFSGGFDTSDPFAPPSKTKSSDPFSSGFESTTASTGTSQEKSRPPMVRQFTSPPEQYASHTSPKAGGGDFNSNDLFASNSPPSPPPQKQNQEASFDFFADLPELQGLIMSRRVLHLPALMIFLLITPLSLSLHSSNNNSSSNNSSSNNLNKPTILTLMIFRD
jgi:hypothetical protein